MKRLLISAAAGLALLASGASFAGNLSGHYRCLAHDPGSHKVSHSQLLIRQDKQNHDIYHLTWHFADKNVSHASGFVQKAHGGEVLSATYHASRQAPHVKHKDHAGLISYVVKDHRLVHGEWMYVGSNVIGTETCTPDHHAQHPMTHKQDSKQS